MKLLITLDFPPEIGGIQRYLNDIVMHTFSSDDVVIAGGKHQRSAGNDSRYPCRIVRVSVPFAFVNKKVLLLPLFFLLWYQVVRRKSAVTILAGNIYAALVPGFMSFVYPLHYHVFCYGTELLPLKKKQSLRGRIWETVLRRADMVYYLTKATHRLLEVCDGCPPCIQMFPKIDLPAYTVCRKEHLDGKLHEVHLLSVGRLVPHKGHAVLIEAAAGLSAQHPWHLTIVGNGPEHKRLISLVQQHALGRRITIAPDVSGTDLAELYKDADIFIFPSLENGSAIEGFGIVLLEAMAYGAAIIASRSGGIVEVVDDNMEIAQLVPPGNPEVLKNTLTALMADNERRFTMAYAAHQLLKDRYVWK